MQTRIKGYTFTLSEPFTAGSVITKGEAQALNALRAENLCNSLRRLVNEAIAVLPEGVQLAQHQLDEIQAKITRADENYQFLERHVPKVRLSDTDAEALAIARERVESQLRSLGSSLDEDRMEEAVAQTAKLPAVQEEARERIAARRRSLAESLADL